jgi:hypothetical protein
MCCVKKNDEKFEQTREKKQPIFLFVGRAGRILIRLLKVLEKFELRFFSWQFSEVALEQLHF